MKKTVSFLAISMFLVASAYAGEKIVVASAASTQSKAVSAKATVAKVKAAEKKPVSTDYALESFGCCGLPQ